MNKLHLLFAKLQVPRWCTEGEIINADEIRAGKIQDDSIVPAYPDMTNAREEPW